MQWALHKLTILLGLALMCQYCVAQSGYNYGRNSATNIPSTAASNVIRPIPGGFPTAATGAAGAFPSSATTTAYGAAPLLNPTTAYGSFVGQAQPAPTSGIPAAGTTAAGAQKRPSILPQRTSSGIFGTVAGSQPQFASPAAVARVGGTRTGLDTDYEGDYSAIPGVPGVDYPIYAQVPPTNFDCAQQALPGYYSDVEAQCQVFHICAQNRTYSFLCPNGTVFSQETLVCVWWNQFECGVAPSLYANNAFIYDYGSEGVPTNVGYANNQLGGGGSTRSQTTYTTAGAGGRSSTFGAGSIRPMVTTNSYPIIPTAVAPGGVPGAGGGGFLGNAQSAGRFTSSTAVGAQTFPKSTSIGGTGNAGGVGGTGSTTGDGGYSGITGNAYANPQVATSSTNRQYLPPNRP